VSQLSSSLPSSEGAGGGDCDGAGDLGGDDEHGGEAKHGGDGEDGGDGERDGDNDGSDATNSDGGSEHCDNCEHAGEHGADGAHGGDGERDGDNDGSDGTASDGGDDDERRPPSHQGFFPAFALAIAAKTATSRRQISLRRFLFASHRRRFFIAA